MLRVFCLFLIQCSLVVISCDTKVSGNVDVSIKPDSRRGDSDQVKMDSANTDASPVDAAKSDLGRMDRSALLDWQKSLDRSTRDTALLKPDLNKPDLLLLKPDLLKPDLFKPDSKLLLSGETCANANPLKFYNNDADATVTLSGYTDDSSGSCAGSALADVVYVFSISAQKDFSIQLSPPTSGYIPAIYLRRGNCPGAEEGCWPELANMSSRLIFKTNMPADTYYIFIDGQSGGAYHLAVTLY
jgi:hypothetical protein